MQNANWWGEHIKSFCVKSRVAVFVCISWIFSCIDKFFFIGRWTRLRPPYWPVGRWLHHGRDVDQKSHNAGQHWAAPAHADQPTLWFHHCWGKTTWYCTHQVRLMLHCWSCRTNICPHQVWPGVDKYELYQKMELPKGQKRKVKDRLKAYVKDPYALDLIDKLLVLDPAQRTDSDDALNHDFFWTDPMPSDLKNMLSTHNTSMFEYLAPPRRRGHMPQQQPNQSRNPATTSQTEFDRVF